MSLGEAADDSDQALESIRAAAKDDLLDSSMSNEVAGLKVTSDFSRFSKSMGYKSDDEDNGDANDEFDINPFINKEPILRLLERSWFRSEYG